MGRKKRKKRLWKVRKKRRNWIQQVKWLKLVRMKVKGMLALIKLPVIGALCRV